MSKLQGLGPKITYHSTKPKQPSHGGPSHGSSAQNSPPAYYSSGGPPRGSFPEIPNSLFEDGPSPFGGGGSSVSYSSPNSVDHPPVIYRNPSGPPPSGFGPRPGPPPPSYASSRPPSFSSRPPPSYSSGGPPPSYSLSGPPPYSSSSFGSSRPPFGRPPPSSFGPSQGTRNNNLEVFPSQQISYQTQTLNQNEPGYDDVLGNPQSLYSSQSNGRPSYFQNQQHQQQRHSNYEQQQSSYSQNQPQIAKGPSNNYGASFHSIEPVKVAPVYDVNQNFQPSSSDMSGAYSNVQQRQQQPSNVHDTPFESIVNDYAAQADAVTAGSEQMISAVQNGPDMATAASNNQAFSGMQILGQGTSPDGNPMFEVMAGPNAPTYDGHPVDLNKLISMIEPGAQIDTMPSYGGDSDMGASEHQHVYADPSSLETESDAAMASGIMSGNKPVVSDQSQTQLNKDNIKINFNNINDKLHAIASESRPTVVKLDGTRLNDEKLIKEHFDKEIILDDLQENKDHGFIIVGVNTDNDTGDEDEHLHDGTNKTWTMIDSYDNNSKNKDNDDDDLLAIVQQLRNSASSVLVDRFKNDLTSAATTPIPSSDDNSTTEQHTSRHPNHNYYPELSPTRLTLEETNEYDNNETQTNSSVINPIFDSVKPTRYDDDGVSDNSTLLLKSDHQDDVDDDDDNDQLLLDDDLIMTDDDEMAASGSRNVKSVAIIVTPPPNYVKIKNKYKKAITPLSSLTSSTTTEMPASTIDLIETPIPSAEARSLDDEVSESLSINKFSSNPGGQPNQTANNDHQSSISTENTAASSLESINPLPNSGNNKDSISNISTISSGIDASQFSNNNGNGELESRSRKAPRYPVYRGKTSA